MHSINTGNEIFRYTSKRFGTPHGMFARWGGTSRGRFEALNLSFGVGDHHASVMKNRDLVKQILDIDFLVSSKQVHADAVAVVEGIGEDVMLGEFDALVTDQPNVGLLIQQADCQAVLLHDPVSQVIAAIHNGWRGSVANIISKTIDKMHQHFGAEPVNIKAVISPSLGPCCAEFINYRQELPTQFHTYQRHANHFDFWAISRFQLQHAGIITQNIDVTATCTCCSKHFFSYRRAKKNGTEVTGRNGSLIALPR